ncbi:MAG: 4-hydroxybenzoate octaprenyltransferase [Rhodospirillaceae bacterium]|nr:4-hydroxybenzoate octaprenyltransferase [Rhodospirillaceae bacterium]|tara:strand:- start:13103 stop:14035 length:933 start_codon:yes stop_codon:yes gene_type:complete
MSNKKKDLNSKKLADSSFNIIIDYLPDGIIPYIKLSRFDRPIGIWLLMLPAWWSISISLSLENETKEILLYLYFFLGSIAMRGAGCTFNDLIDMKLDSKVKRTSNRPLPSGEITIFKASIWLVFQSLIGFSILIQFNFLTIFIGLFSLLLVAIYPFMKRITWWPQIFLGLAFNFGVILAWVEINNQISHICIIIYLAGIFWTLGYDTIYALMDINDDKLVGIKSSAIYIGEKNLKIFLSIFYSFTFLLLSYCSITVGVKWFFWPIFLLSSSHLAWQIITLKPKLSNDCLKKFKSNSTFGFAIFLCFLIGN